MSVRRKWLLSLVLALGALGVVIQVAVAMHPRPKAASPIRVSLVPAYEECTAPNLTHGPPLAFPSCSPPVQASDYVTVGTPDADGATANSVGSVRIHVVTGTPGPAEDSDLELTGHITDVRCKSGVSTCGAANTAGGPDYTGELEINTTFRVTDHYNGPDADEAATLVDLPQPIGMHCAGTPDPSVGSTCRYPVVFCSSCPPPKEGVRTVIEVTQIRVHDGGPDGIARTEDNTLFMVQGVFIP
jgi:hypothetical protein